MRAAKDFKLGFGRLGNGTTVWNANKEERGDYERVAHISEDGKTISWYVKDTPVEIKAHIDSVAQGEVKPGETLNGDKLPEGFDLERKSFEGFHYVQLNPQFNGGKNLWLRKGRIQPMYTYAFENGWHLIYKKEGEFFKTFISLSESVEMAKMDLILKALNHIGSNQVAVANEKYFTTWDDDNFHLIFEKDQKGIFLIHPGHDEGEEKDAVDLIVKALNEFSKLPVMPV